MGEFGRTVFVQGDITKPAHGRDHFGRAYSMWMAGGGVKAGTIYGETDEFSYNVVRDPVHVHDWQATVLHMMGIDHEKLTYRFQGRQFRLTDVHGKVVKGILA
jgi:arylsulfatase A-like enzyme